MLKDYRVLPGRCNQQAIEIDYLDMGGYAAVRLKSSVRPDSNI